MHRARLLATVFLAVCRPALQVGAAPQQTQQQFATKVPIALQLLTGNSTLDEALGKAGVTVADWKKWFTDAMLAVRNGHASADDVVSKLGLTTALAEKLGIEAVRAHAVSAVENVASTMDPRKATPEAMAYSVARQMRQAPGFTQQSARAWVAQCDPSQRNSAGQALLGLSKVYAQLGKKTGSPDMIRILQQNSAGLALEQTADLFVKIASTDKGEARANFEHVAKLASQAGIGLEAAVDAFVRLRKAENGSEDKDGARGAFTAVVDAVRQTGQPIADVTTAYLDVMTALGGNMQTVEAIAGLGNLVRISTDFHITMAQAGKIQSDLKAAGPEEPATNFVHVTKMAKEAGATLPEVAAAFALIAKAENGEEDTRNALSAVVEVAKKTGEPLSDITQAYLDVLEAEGGEMKTKKAIALLKSLPAVSQQYPVTVAEAAELHLQIGKADASAEEPSPDQRTTNFKHIMQLSKPAGVSLQSGVAAFARLRKAENGNEDARKGYDVVIQAVQKTGADIASATDAYLNVLAAKGGYMETDKAITAFRGLFNMPLPSSGKQARK
jgi:hypothetical protein